MPAQTPQPVIIIRKKVHAHGHHGGAWKVAYADFVTAMLSLFIVLWLLSSSETIQKAVGGYFTDPKGTARDIGNGLRGAGSESLAIPKEDMNKLRERLEEAIKSSASFRKIQEHVVFTVTGEGLRVELLEGNGSTFFETGNSRPTPFGKDLLKRLAEEIGKLPNKVTVEGHTDSHPYHGISEYSNWELSADRANAARRWMQENGMRADQCTQVRGFADQSLRIPAHPEDGSNRRVTVVIQYLAPKADDEKAAPPPQAARPSAAPAIKPRPVAAKPHAPGRKSWFPWK